MLAGSYLPRSAGEILRAVGAMTVLRKCRFQGKSEDKRFPRFIRKGNANNGLDLGRTSCFRKITHCKRVTRGDYVLMP